MLSQNMDNKLQLWLKYQPIAAPFLQMKLWMTDG